MSGTKSTPSSTPGTVTSDNIPASVQASTGQKRARSQLSCTPCRQGKLKCNREHPACDQCMKRLREPFCVYVAPPTRSKPRANVKGRIRHLESLVVDLMNATNSKEQPSGDRLEGDYHDVSNLSGPPASVQDAIAHKGTNGRADDIMEEQNYTAGAFGRMKISHTETSYVGGSHWTAILNDIMEVKKYLDEDDEPPKKHHNATENQVSQGAAFILGNPVPVTKMELLDSMPPKSTVDRLVSQWFNSQDPAHHIIHAPTFQDEYKQFWRDPPSAPIMWLGLLSSILYVSTICIQRAARDELSPLLISDMEMIRKFRNIAASALVLGDFSNARPYTIECLLIYMEGEYMLSNESQVKIWVLIGLLVRLALRMGYHRDSSHYRDITPFHGEMRRRVWHLIYQLEVLISFQLGLPSMINKLQSDTLPPHNLMDRDFSTESTELPASRPVADMTPVSYSIAKCRICHVFAMATEFSQAVALPTYPEVMNLDIRLQESFELVPSDLRIRPLDQSITDAPDLIMNRFNLELLYQKTRCVLHRRYLSEAHTDTRFAYSQRTCIHAAVNILQHHSTIYDACQVGGQLSPVKWYMASLTTHDFLLAAMIICLELNFNHKMGSELVEDSCNRPGHVETNDMIKALERSHHIWSELEMYSTEVRKATKALAIMLRKVKGPSVHSDTEQSFLPSWPTPSINANDRQARQTADPGISSLSQGFESGDPAGFTSIGDMLDMPLSLDWELWDNHINGQEESAPDIFWPTEVRLREYEYS